MKKVLIINGHQYYENFAEGKLTGQYIKAATDFLEENNFEVEISNIDKGYDAQKEVEKILEADYIILQHPVYWMGLPWITKKYIDEVFMTGYGKIWKDDGRTKEDPSKRYGSGGLLHGKKYMLSLTYNCPEIEFDDKDGFFNGMSLDDANVQTHKIFEFCGAKRMKTNAIFDIFKGDIDINAELNKFREILKDNFLGE